MVRSFDPNDIVGPAGIGEKRYVARGERLAYTIDFENVSNATASAQMIRVTLPEDPNLDWTTLQLGEICLGNRFDLNLVGLASGSSRGLTSESGYPVRTTVVEEDGKLVWTMRIWDETTADHFPDDAFAGILPPNNPTNHCGEGFVKYSVCVKSDAPQEAVVTAKGTIVFDTNQPIDTDPFWTNTVGLDIEVEPFADNIGYHGPYDGEAHGIDVVVREPKSGAAIKYAETEAGPYGTTPVTYRDEGTNTVWFTVEKTGYIPYRGFAKVVIDPADPSTVTLEPGETAGPYDDEAAARVAAEKTRVSFPKDLAEGVAQADKERYVRLFRVVAKETAEGWKNVVEFTPEAEAELKAALTAALGTFDLSRITLEDTDWVVPNPVKGLYYALERTTDLNAGFNVHAYDAAMSVSVVFTVNEADNPAGRAFYRLSVSACPPK